MTVRASHEKTNFMLEKHVRSENLMGINYQTSKIMTRFHFSEIGIQHIYSALKWVFSLTRMTVIIFIFLIKFCYQKDFSLPKQSLISISIL